MASDASFYVEKRIATERLEKERQERHEELLDSCNRLWRENQSLRRQIRKFKIK